MGEARMNESWPPERGPRERLVHHGQAALSSQELIALLVGSGTAGRPAAELARLLLLRAGGLRGLARLEWPELKTVSGIGPARAARLAAAFELARRLATEAPPRGSAIQSGSDVQRLLAPRLRDLRKEVFVALLLDGKNRLLREERVSEGSLTSSIVHPREVFGPAIRESAGAIVVAHNHPSGDPTPSREDLEVTARLAEVGRLVGIGLLDHVILGDPGYVSLRERGCLPAGTGDR
ncbi:MAG: DNA repair protein RadC [Planctomycetes bacterium]|nr:DNA repair protein RadC [Planctomycetota bacterium]